MPAGGISSRLAVPSVNKAARIARCCYGPGMQQLRSLVKTFLTIRLLRRAALCGTAIAPFLLASCATLPAARGTVDRPLTILTWAVPRPALDGSSNCRRGASDRTRLAQIAYALDADVVAFRDFASAEEAEEAFGSDRYTVILDRAADVLADACAPHGRNGVAVRRGVSFQVPGRLAEQRTSDANRHASMEIALRQGEHPRLRLFSVELAANCDQAASPACSAQLTGIARWITDAVAGRFPFILVGSWDAGLGLPGDLATPFHAGIGAVPSAGASCDTATRQTARTLADRRALARVRDYRQEAVIDGSGRTIACLTVTRIVL